ncbi:MAG TPA: hypothetical protein ENF75_02900 [Acidilobales archaeon]|nr:hypothetical protein [Acidilobales archaeon]
MRSEKEIKEFLKRLEKAYEEWRSQEIPYPYDYRDPVYGIEIHTCIDHDGLYEWIRALKWVLGEEVK